jgi:aryl-alcohol dehydrogenase-like predicted oxidoreductase
MQKRTIGHSTLAISPLVFGGNVFGWTVDEQRTFALLDRFVERGFNAIDTADSYCGWVPGREGGESETLIGRWLAKRGKRDDVVIMTKVGMWAKHPGLSAANIATSIEGSLRRLGTDYVDIYFAHIDDQDTAQQETLVALDRLVRDGKVRVLGASNHTPQRLESALAVSAEHDLASYQILQPLYNLYDRQTFEAALDTLCRARNMSVVSFFPLCAGFLTGKYRSAADVEGRPRAKALQGYANARGFAIVEALREIAIALGATPAQVAVAWLLSRPAVTAPIASATSIEQLDELLSAVSLTLNAAQQAQLEAVSA